MEFQIVFVMHSLSTKLLKENCTMCIPVRIITFNSKHTVDSREWGAWATV